MMNVIGAQSEEGKKTVFIRWIRRIVRQNMRPFPGKFFIGFQASGTFDGGFERIFQEGQRIDRIGKMEIHQFRILADPQMIELFLFFPLEITGEEDGDFPQNWIENRLEERFIAGVKKVLVKNHAPIRAASLTETVTSAGDLFPARPAAQWKKRSAGLSA
ncbi:hypothetical protein SDC9_196061 [bioreactor metagenome]|uniref:Uncharacterized protein n=1 Tax=bioreactor metagenome TaxID=1076179 RepID=A0A645IJG4_9ZZZZ